MRRSNIFDSIVLQAISDDDDLQTAKKVAVTVGGELDLVKHRKFKPQKKHYKFWKDIVNRKIPKNASFIGLIHHPNGQSIPVIRYGNGAHLQLHFHGLHKYTKNVYVLSEGSILRKTIFDEFIEKWDGMLKLSQYDIAMDFYGKQWHEYTNTWIHRLLCEKQGKPDFKISNSVFYQESKPQYVKVTAYYKTLKDKLCYPLIRIEFSFRGQYWRNCKPMGGKELLKFAKEKIDSYLNRRSL